MNKIVEWLDGKKTFIGAIAMFILGGLLATNVINQEQFEAGATIVGAWTVYGLRSAMKKLE